VTGDFHAVPVRASAAVCAPAAEANEISAAARMHFAAARASDPFVAPAAPRVPKDPGVPKTLTAR
jgi:hypothetical protein